LGVLHRDRRLKRLSLVDKMSVLGMGSGGRKAAELFDADRLTDVSVDALFKILDSTDADLSDFVEGMSFAGFNKDKFIILAGERLGPRRIVKLTLLAAMRGTNLKKILSNSTKVDPDVKTAYEKGLILSGGKGPNDLTMGRLLSCFPQIASFYMLKYNCPKKITTHECPAAIQFPAAAGLPMSSSVRMQHVSFCLDFSKLIGSTFSETFYTAAFRGQCAVEDVPPDVKKLLGNPTLGESLNVDLSMIFRGVTGGVKI
jgi:hypothetical protein